MIKRLHGKVLSLVQRVLVTRSDDSTVVPQVQVTGMGGRAHVLEVLQPQGLYFCTPAGAEGVELACGGSRASAVVVGAQDRGTWPAGTGIPEGTGGLHYLGAWKVFLADDGTVHLGEQTGETEIPRDDALQTELARLKSELDAIKTDLDNHKSVFDAHVHLITVVSVDGDTATAAPPAAPFTVTAAPADPGETKSTYGRIT